MRIWKFALVLIWLVTAVAPTGAATIQLDSFLEVGVPVPGAGTVGTHQYIELRIDRPTPLDMVGVWRAGVGLNIFSFNWSGGHEINSPGVLPRLDLRPTQPTGSVSGNLSPGNYLFPIVLSESDWDSGDGFVPYFGVENTGGFGSGVFSLTITGDFVPKAIWQGNLDGTFTVIPIPEPCGLLGLFVGAGWLASRRRRAARLT
jgi:hypothetical protein